MLFDWPSIAILSAAVSGLVNVIDSHLVSQRLPSLRAFLLPIGTIHLGYALILLALFPLPEAVGRSPLLVAIASGLLRTAAVTIMLYSLKREEVSRVIPVVYTYPIFVAIMAVPLLGETLIYLEWLAIVVVVAGAIIISFRQGHSRAITRFGRTFILLFCSSLLFAAADISSKYALRYISFWNMFSLSAFCMSTTFLLVSVRPHVIRQLINMERRGSAVALLIGNETMAPVAIILAFLAMQNGPVSLVSTIMGSRSIFVVLYALILSRVSPMFLEWQRGGAMLVLRLIATAMIVGGIAFIYLT